MRWYMIKALYSLMFLAGVFMLFIWAIKNIILVIGVILIYMAVGYLNDHVGE